MIQAQYMFMLSQELANEQGRPDIRGVAGLALKNALTAKVSNYRPSSQNLRPES
jgi:hypothetical protein